MEISKITEKIIKQRKNKGLSYENMAFDLGISPVAYRKIETGETKLSVERLFAISQLLETDIAEILEISKQPVFNQNNNTTANAFAHVEHLYHENKEVYEKLIAAKDEQIALLTKLLGGK